MVIYVKRYRYQLHKLALMLVFVVLSTNLSASSYHSNIINNQTIERVAQDIRNNKYGKISSMVIFHNNRVLYENYFGFNQQTTLHPISSVTKSITSLAIGICMDRGFITSLDFPIYTLFPEYKNIFDNDSLKRNITLRHLLNQTSGFKWDEWTIHYSYAGNSLIELSQNPNNWCEVILSLPMASKPGTAFTYNSGCSELIKEIICRTTGRDFEEFVKLEIFNKIGIFNTHWDKYPGNGAPAWGGISLTTRDMAKIGLLIINKGALNNNQVVSWEWLEQSIKPEVNAGKVNYGLHWWVSTQPDGNPLVYAAGYGDQYVYVAPDKNLVIAFNSQNFTDHKWEKNHEDLIKDILKAYNYNNQ